MEPTDVQYIIVHDQGASGDPPASAIRRDHMQNRGWSDIGYHWVIRKDGDVEAGRPESRAGAHVAGPTVTIPNLNARSLGVMITDQLPFDRVPRAQQQALVEKVAQLCLQYGVPVDNVRGHGEVEPGNSDFAKSQMDRLRPLVETRLAELRREQGTPAPVRQASAPPAATPRTPAPQTSAPQAPPPRTPAAPSAPAPAPAAGGPTGRAGHPLPGLTDVQPSAAKGQQFGVMRSGGYPHNGADYSAPVGSRIATIDGGTVVAVVSDKFPGERRGAGNYVIVRHDGTGMHSIYEHMENGSFAVRPGQRVEAGQALGRVGLTGDTDGPHLHLSVFAGGNDAAFADGHFLRSLNGGTPLDPTRVVGKDYTTLPGLNAPRPGAIAPPRDLLTVGMEGADVRQLQHQLAALGYARQVGQIDGTFDAALAATVRQFQKDRGLPEKYQTGNAGPITRREIGEATQERNERNAARQQAPTAPSSGDGAATPTSPTAQPPRQTPATTPVPPASQTPAPPTASQPPVAQPPGPTPPTLATPPFVAGIAAGAVAGAVVGAASGAPTDASGAGQALSRGASGAAVTAMQQQLKSLGLPLGAFGPARDGVDGQFGPVTEAAVRQFEKSRGLPETGVASPTTLAALATAAREAATRASPGSGDGASTPPPHPNAGAFIREADEAVSNLLDRHTADVPGALRGLIEATRGPGSGVLGRTTAEDVQQAFGRLTAGTASLPLSTTEAGMIAGVLDERARLVGEGATVASPPPSGDGASGRSPLDMPVPTASDGAGLAVPPARPEAPTVPSSVLPGGTSVLPGARADGDAIGSSLPQTQRRLPTETGPSL